MKIKTTFYILKNKNSNEFKAGNLNGFWQEKTLKNFCKRHFSEWDLMSYSHRENANLKGYLTIKEVKL